MRIQGPVGPLALETRAGEPLDQERIARDVRRLWRTGRFDDIRVEASPAAEGTELTFRFVEKPRPLLRRVRFEPEREKRAFYLPPGEWLDRGAAQRAAAELRRQLQAEGYADAQVEAEIVPVKPGWADLKFHVDAGERSQAEVRVEGDLGLPRADLNPALRGLRKLGFTEAKAEQAAARLRSLYFSRGYLDARVEPRTTRHDGHRVSVTFSVTAGERAVLRSLDVPKLCRCLLDARRRAWQQGQLDFAARLSVSRETQPDLRVETTAGPAYTVSRIEFRGHHTVDDGTVRRALLLDEGGALDLERLHRSLERISRLGLFEPVGDPDVQVLRDPASRSAIVRITLRESRPRRWYLSGPVGPASFAGPLRAGLMSRLPGWGSGLLSGPTYSAVLTASAFTPAWSWLALASPGTRPATFGLERPVLPGQWWTSGFFASPQLGWQEMVSGYSLAHLRQGTKALLETKEPSPAPLVVPVEGAAAGPLLCEAPRSRWARLRAAAALAIDVAWSVRPF